MPFVNSVSLSAKSLILCKNFVWLEIDYIGVGVGAIIIDEECRIFLARRGPKVKNEQGLWEFPGGSVEFGETSRKPCKGKCTKNMGLKY